MCVTPNVCFKHTLCDREREKEREKERGRINCGYNLQSLWSTVHIYILNK